MLFGVLVAFWLPAASLADSGMSDCRCTCDNQPVSCADAEAGACLQRCGQGEQPVWWPRVSEEAIRRQQEAQAYQQAVFWAERSDIDAEIAAQRALRAERRALRRGERIEDSYSVVQPEPAWEPEPYVEPSAPEPASGFSDACLAAMDELERSQAAFVEEAETHGTDFARDELQAAAEKLARAEQSEEAWAEALESLEELMDDLEAWSADAAAWLSCYQTDGCDTKAIEERSREELKALLAEHDEDAAEAAERVEKASQFLESYGRRLAEAQMTHATNAAACSGAP